MTKENGHTEFFSDCDRLANMTGQAALDWMTETVEHACKNDKSHMDKDVCK